MSRPAARSAFQSLHWNPTLPFSICQKKGNDARRLQLPVHSCGRLPQVDISCPMLVCLIPRLVFFPLLLKKAFNKEQESCTICSEFWLESWLDYLFCNRDGYGSMVGAGMFGWTFWRWGGGWRQNLFYEGNWCFAAREEGKAGMKLCRGSDPYRSIWERWGRTTGAWQHGMAGLGCLSGLRYS